ncbi:PhoD_N domain-containing protein, partial [Haematococcus lacustris]
VDVANLRPTKVYYYQFIVDGTASMIGRSKTLPRANDKALERVNLAVASCAWLSYGYFNAYDAIADWAEDNRLDAVLHLGDYIYEYNSSSSLLWDESDPSKGTRSHYPRKEIVTLQDYRERHRQWDSDRDTMRMRGALPLIAVWDDHEFTNNAFRTGAQSPEDRHRIYRQFQFGKLASLLMLDTRFTGRDPEQPSQPFNTSDMRYFNSSRSLLGKEQRKWVRDNLLKAKADRVTWKVLGQQIVFAPAWRFTNGAINTDGWDGYAAERERILDTIEQHAIDNVVVLTGDVHSSFAMDVPREQFKAYEPETGAGYDPATGRGSLAVEMVCNSVTSLSTNGPCNAVGFDNLFRTQNRNVKYVQSLYKVHLKPTITTYLTIHCISNSVTELIPMGC